MISVDGYLIDAVLRENHRDDAEATSFPVEEGANYSDHIRNLPPEVTLEHAVVTDDPLPGAVAEARSQSTTRPSEEALAKLREIRAARKPISIVSSLGRYDDMAMVGLEIEVDKDTGKALSFTAEFKHIDLVQNVRTTVRVLLPSGAKKKKLGYRSGANFDGPTMLYEELDPDGIHVSYKKVGWDQGLNGGKGAMVIEQDDGTFRPITDDERAKLNSQLTKYKNDQTYDAVFDDGKGEWFTVPGTSPMREAPALRENEFLDSIPVFPPLMFR